ncbi:MAG: lyase family protein [Nanoarchaeota archaeon]
MTKDLDLVSKLSPEELAYKRFSLQCVSPDDGKYEYASRRLKPYLSDESEWRTCAYMQRILLETRVEFGKAEKRHLDEVDAALPKIDFLNMALLEDKVTRHDQLAVIEELGRFVSEETKAVLHPGTTSYDILDPARAYLFRKAWKEVIRPEVTKSIETLCDFAEQNMEVLQVGRTHLQNTSPVPLGLTFSIYAARLANRLQKCDEYFNDLKGKVSGIVGTGASIEMVIGEGKSIEFEKAVLAKLGIKPDYASTQITPKESLADVGHGLTTLMHVLADFTNDTRMLYSSAIGEVTSLDSSARLGGSSADAAKNNPINYENTTGKAAVVESGMRILYEMINSDFQRDLRNSVQARYQPRLMMVQTYEAFSRLNKALPQLWVIRAQVEENLLPVRKSPSEAMVAILRGAGWNHSEYGAGHDFVKEISKRVKSENRTLLDIALEDAEFTALYETLPANKRDVLKGKLEKYIGSSLQRAVINMSYAKGVIADPLY